MELGVVFPTTEIGRDPAVIQEFARTAENCGYSHLITYDQVIGANPDRPDWEGPYDVSDPFHEPFVLFGYLAAATNKLRLVTGIIVLPQRQTALVAKQVAELDVLSEGRLTFGAGVGWDPVSFEAMGMDMSVRGPYMEEQIEVLRQLWERELVDFDGEFHTISDAGINPRPVQEPMPLWMGGEAEASLRRVARQADGWLPTGKWRHAENPVSELVPIRDYLYDRLHEEGRESHEFDVVGRVALGSDRPDEWVERTRAWQEFGATHVAVDTMGMGLEGADHKEKIVEFQEVVAPEIDL